MTKKIAYHTYYYSIVDDITSVQLKSSTELPLVDVSSLQQWMETHQIGGVLSTESHYPWRMQQVPQAPYVVYYQGTLEVLNKPTLAIVGPRQISPYAQEVLENTFEHLRSFDVVTVSGMAPGVDTLCHELSLKYKIPTIAILGGGFRGFLRSGRRDLMKRIVESGGLIISEYKHSFTPTHRSFPQRNRIIAGLADVVFLPEAQEKSGSLITADIGYKLQKPVVAPMNSIFAETSRGTNRYISSGYITPLADLQSFLETYFTRTHTQTRGETIESKDVFDDLHDDEKKIVTLLKMAGELSFHSIVEQTHYTSQQLLIYMSTLEIKGIVVQHLPGKYMYIK